MTRAELIEKARKLLGLKSESELARKMGITRQYLYFSKITHYPCAEIASKLEELTKGKVKAKLFMKKNQNNS